MYKRLTHLTSLSKQQNYTFHHYKPKKYTDKTYARKCRYCVQASVEEHRINKANIQMLSSSLHEQIFKTNQNQYDDETLKKVEHHLKSQNLLDKSPSVAPNINFKLPNLHGTTIAEHFHEIAKKQSKSYFNLAEGLANSLLKPPPRPKQWRMTPGWTKYYENGSYVSVVEPPDVDLVFDVEVCMKAGNVPVIAVALSSTHWYCWVSEYLTNPILQIPSDIKPKDLILFGEQGDDHERLLIGHNVCFDRSYLSGEYKLKSNKTRFLDTLSLHMCVSGVTNEQRNYLNKKNPIILYDWMEVGTTNSLAKLYQFYCGGTLDKSTRDLFVEGSLEDIRNNFNECVEYCSKDVSSTLEVFQTLWPMYLDHLPHPVSFAGMLEMGKSYLPIDSSWKDYIERSESMFHNVTNELKKSLIEAAEDTLKLLVHQRYKDDPWLWSLDWSLHKTVSKGINQEELSHVEDFKQYVHEITKHLSDKRRLQLHLPGYPKWYRDLCKRESDIDYKPGPCGISSQTKVTPSLLRMTWDGYPLHYQRKYGWGYLKAAQQESKLRPDSEEEEDISFPLQNYLNAIKSSESSETQHEVANPMNKAMDQMYSSSNGNNGGVDIGIDGVRFFKIPHRDGESFNVGNPLAKDYLSKIEDGTLSSTGGHNAKQTIELNKMLAFWRNGRKRIMTQSTVWTDENKKGRVTVGAILPQVITAGTVTRRAVEPTWLTASNPRTDRIGSELKSLVRAPAGYKLIGADVDSQELWIASVLGDAQFSHMHGSTALSWMTLQGKKQDGTDLHSRTASTIGMDRDQAKIFNYGRIYGAGEKFAVRLLMQFNHKLTEREAEEKARLLYEHTKGVKSHKLTCHGIQLAEQMGIHVTTDGLVTYNELKSLLNEYNISWRYRAKVVHSMKKWCGGSESEMFNKLENIALSNEPRTPVLGCLITKALQPKYVQNHYKTSRVNWVVQSSAVDYLHLMLVCMNWLIREYKIDARFCISIHDEVRYIVNEKDQYRAALALQITNLLTRSMFAYQLDMFDLPQSVAFFSSIDIDQVLRKEVDMDCITPSNPYGLFEEYNIPQGESLDIYAILKKTNGNLSN